MPDKHTITTLRKLTGAGVTDCLEALKAAGDDMEKAREILIRKGMDKAAKKSDRSTDEGVIGTYIHSNKKIASLVALRCETDFVARTEDFQNLAHDLAMQITALSPLYVSPDQIPEEVLKKQRDIFQEQLLAESKPDNILQKIIDGKMKKYYEEVCLLKQRYFKNEDVTVEEHIKQKIAIIGENITIKKFTRFEI